MSTRRESQFSHTLHNGRVFTEAKHAPAGRQGTYIRTYVGKGRVYFALGCTHVTLLFNILILMPNMYVHVSVHERVLRASAAREQFL